MSNPNIPAPSDPPTADPVTASTGGTETATTRQPRSLVWIVICAVVVIALTAAGVGVWKYTQDSKGHGAEVTAEAVRDRLPDQLSQYWVAEGCVRQAEKPAGLGLPAEIPSVSCVLFDDPQGGTLVTLFADPELADAVRRTGADAPLADLGTSADGAHRLSYVRAAGTLYDSTEDAVLRYGPFPTEEEAKKFATANGLR